MYSIHTKKTPQIDTFIFHIVQETIRPKNKKDQVVVKMIIIITIIMTNNYRPNALCSSTSHKLRNDYTAVPRYSENVVWHFTFYMNK